MNPLQRCALAAAATVVFGLVLWTPTSAGGQEDVPAEPETGHNNGGEGGTDSGGDGGTPSPSEVAADPNAGNVTVGEEIPGGGAGGSGPSGAPEGGGPAAPSGPVDPCQYQRYDDPDGGMTIPGTGHYLSTSYVDGLGNPQPGDLLQLAYCPAGEDCPGTAIDSPLGDPDYNLCANWVTAGGTTDPCTYATFADPDGMLAIPGHGTSYATNYVIDAIGEAPDDDMLVQLAACPTAVDCPGETLVTNPGFGGDPLSAYCASWVTPAQATLTPEDLAERLLANIDELLPAPEVEMSPEDGRPWIVHAPVFFHVSNWDPVLLGPECDGPLCVDAAAQPSRITFESGEPDADLFSCDVPGLPYDPAGPDWETQASSPDACVFYYTQRSGIADRPPEWQGALMVTWTVTWTSTLNDEPQPYTPDPATATEITREINEVRAIITQ